MGMIVISTKGSFPKCQQRTESALEGGHAAAIGRAVKYLTAMLPDAIALDHKLHDSGDRPPDADFGKAV